MRELRYEKINLGRGFEKKLKRTHERYWGDEMELWQYLCQN